MNLSDTCTCDDQTTGYDPTDYADTTDPTTDYADYGEYEDMTSMSVDSDFDGYAETTIVDLDGDGLADAAIYEDVVSGASMIVADLDGDGVMETMAADYDGDGVIDSETTLTDDASDTSDDDTSETVPFVVEDDPTTDVPPDDDGIHGDPMADVQYHQAQPGPVDCLPTSVAMTLSEITGETVAAEEVVQAAHDMGVMTPTGMAPEDGVRLLEHFGVDAESTSGTLDDLRTALDDGRDVIIGLDADDLYGTGDAPFASDIVSGHAVVITGIDDEAGLVYVNDPGFPDGAGVAIPVDVFEDAWEDADNTMIVTQEGDLGAAGGGPEAADADPGVLDLILLPLTFVVQH